MNLPKLDKPIHIIILPVSGQKIEIQPFVIKQEKSLLTSIDKKKKDELILIFEKLINDCVITENFDVKSLNMTDFFYLVLNIRMKSTGENINGTLICSECKKNTEFDINLEESISIENPECLSIIVKVNNGLSLKIIPTNINTLFNKEDIDIIDIVSSSIDSVIYKKEIYTEFSQEELKNNILDVLTKMDFDKISEGMSSLAKMIIKFDFVCINCKHKNNYLTDDITVFF